MSPADFIQLCDALRATGATVVAAGEYRAEFPPARREAKGPALVPGVKVAPNRRVAQQQTELDAEEREKRRRERELRGVGA